MYADQYRLLSSSPDAPDEDPTRGADMIECAHILSAFEQHHWLARFRDKNSVTVLNARREKNGFARGSPALGA